MPMDLSRECLKHAAGCKCMAKSIHSAEDKAAWTHMAERWQWCADWFAS
jgi:hypothetical protein